MNFTCVVLKSGAIWSFGEGGSGQLGTKRVSAQMCPILVMDSGHNSSFIDIACGWAHTIALTEKGEIFTWGINTYGQLGYPDQKARFQVGAHIVFLYRFILADLSIDFPPAHLLAATCTWLQSI